MREAGSREMEKCLVEISEAITNESPLYDDTTHASEIAAENQGSTIEVGNKDSLKEKTDLVDDTGQLSKKDTSCYDSETTKGNSTDQQFEIDQLKERNTNKSKSDEEKRLPNVGENIFVTEAEDTIVIEDTDDEEMNSSSLTSDEYDSNEEAVEINTRKKDNSSCLKDVASSYSQENDTENINTSEVEEYTDDNDNLYMEIDESEVEDSNDSGNLSSDEEEALNVNNSEPDKQIEDENDKKRSAMEEDYPALTENQTSKKHVRNQEHDKTDNLIDKTEDKLPSTTNLSISSDKVSTNEIFNDKDNITVENSIETIVIQDSENDGENNEGDSSSDITVVEKVANKPKKTNKISFNRKKLHFIQRSIPSRSKTEHFLNRHKRHLLMHKMRKSLDTTHPRFRKPLAHGWVRELVFRNRNSLKRTRLADVYYYTPRGKKLRSSIQVKKHLTPGLSMNNFTFEKESIGVNDNLTEIVRFARINLGNRLYAFNSNPSSYGSKLKALMFKRRRILQKRARRLSRLRPIPISDDSSSDETKDEDDDDFEVEEEESEEKESEEEEVNEEEEDEEDDEEELSHYGDSGDSGSHERVLRRRRFKYCNTRCRKAFNLYPTVDCVRCNRKYHLQCINIPNDDSDEEDLTEITNYVCKNCNIEMRQRRELEESLPQIDNLFSPQAPSFLPLLNPIIQITSPVLPEIRMFNEVQLLNLLLDIRDGNDIFNTSRTDFPYAATNGFEMNSTANEENDDNTEDNDLQEDQSSRHISFIPLIDAVPPGLGNATLGKVLENAPLKGYIILRPGSGNVNDRHSDEDDLDSVQQESNNDSEDNHETLEQREEQVTDNDVDEDNRNDMYYTIPDEEAQEEGDDNNSNLTEEEDEEEEEDEDEDEDEEEEEEEEKEEDDEEGGNDYNNGVVTEEEEERNYYNNDDDEEEEEEKEEDDEEEEEEKEEDDEEEEEGNYYNNDVVTEEEEEERNYNNDDVEEEEVNYYNNGVEEEERNYYNNDIVAEEERNFFNNGDVIEEEVQDYYNIGDIVEEEQNYYYNDEIEEEEERNYYNNDEIAEEERNYYNKGNVLEEEQQNYYNNEEVAGEEERNYYNNDVVAEEEENYNNDVVAEVEERNYFNNEVVAEEEEEPNYYSNDVVAEVEERNYNNDVVPEEEEQNYYNNDVVAEEEEQNYYNNEIVAEEEQNNGVNNEEENRIEEWLVTNPKRREYGTIINNDAGNTVFEEQVVEDFNSAINLDEISQLPEVQESDSIITQDHSTVEQADQIAAAANVENINSKSDTNSEDATTKQSTTMDDETVKKAKKMDAPCNCLLSKTTDIYKCNLFTDHDRAFIHNKFWKSFSWKKKKKFVASLVEKSTAVNQPIASQQSTEPSYSEDTYLFYLKKDGVRLRVCKLMFQNTIGLGKWSLNNWIKNIC